MNCSSGLNQKGWCCIERERVFFREMVPEEDCCCWGVSEELTKLLERAMRATARACKPSTARWRVLLLVLTYKDRGVFACCFIIHFRLLISPSSHTCTKELQNAVRPEYITSSSSKSLLQICCEGPFGLVSSPKPFISNERERERWKTWLHASSLYVSQSGSSDLCVDCRYEQSCYSGERESRDDAQEISIPTNRCALGFWCFKSDFVASNLLQSVWPKIKSPLYNKPLIA